MHLSPADSVVEPAAERFLKVLGWVSDRLNLNVAPIVDINYLRSLPSGSLGHTWAQHLDESGLQPFIKGPRRQQLHDGVHVLTGYGTDPIGEAEVQAFLLGTTFTPANALILLGLLRGIRRQYGTIAVRHPEVRSRLHAAYDRGRKAHFDPDRWQPEHLWEMPLTQVQATFSLTPSSAI